MNKRASGVRMHVSSLPGVPNGNWAFRVTQKQLDELHIVCTAKEEES